MKYLPGILKKIASLLVTLVIISFVTFFAFSVIPGDAARRRLGMDATEEQIAELQKELGLDKNLFVRYGSWALNAVKGEFGTSIQYNMEVTELISERLSSTFGLAIVSLILIVLISVPISVLSSRKPGRAVDVTVTTLSQIGMATPQFFLGILLTYVFGIVFNLFKAGSFVAPGKDLGKFLSFIILPGLAVAIPKSSMLVKFLRDGIVAEKKRDYVRTARAKGVSETGILYGHVLKNAIFSGITFFAMIAAEVLAGSIVVEQVFSIPGLGRLLVTSISNRDFPVVSAIVLYMASLVVVLNTVADISYRLVDPRVK